MLGRRNTHFDSSAVGMHHIPSPRTIHDHLIAVLIDVRMQYNDNIILLDALQERLVRDTAMFNSVSRIRTRLSFLRVLNSINNHLDLPIAVGVTGNLQPADMKS